MVRIYNIVIANQFTVCDNNIIVFIYETAPYDDRLPTGCARCLNVSGCVLIATQ